MDTSGEAGREFWRGVLDEGGATQIPRWTLESGGGGRRGRPRRPGGRRGGAAPADRRAAVPLHTLLLAAHAAVLAALSGDRDVTTGYVPGAGRPPLPCRLSTAPRSWRALVQHAHQVESGLLAHRDFPVADLLRELGSVDPPFETVLDPADGGDVLPEHAVLHVAAPPARRAPRAAPVPPGRRPRRGRRRPDRRLPPHRPRGDGRRSRRRARHGRACSPRGAPPPAGGVRRAAPGPARPPVPRAVRGAGGRRTRTGWPRCTGTPRGPTGSSTTAPTGWAGRCSRAD